MTNSKLEKLSNLAIAILCLTISALLVDRHVLSPRRDSPRMVEKGQRLSPPSALRFDDSERTLLVSLSPTCGFCSDSLGFYRSLIERRNALSRDVRLVAMVGAADLLDEERQVLSSSGVEVDALLVADFEALGIPGTPILVLVDPRGEVLEVWKGKLTGEGEEEVRQTLGLT